MKISCATIPFFRLLFKKVKNILQGLNLNVKKQYIDPKINSNDSRIQGFNLFKKKKMLELK